MFWVSGFGFRVSGLEFWALGSGFWAWGSGFRHRVDPLEALVFRISGLVSGYQSFGVRVRRSGVGVRVIGSKAQGPSRFCNERKEQEKEED